MAGWQTLGDGEGQGGLACFSPWGCKDLDTTGQLTNKGTHEEVWNKTNIITAV